MKVMIRCDSNAQRGDRIEELCEWVRSLGVTPENIRSAFAIVSGESSYELHLSEYVRNKHGKQIVDVAHNDVVSEPLIVDLGERECWPTWLNEMREPTIVFTPPTPADSQAYGEALRRVVHATRAQGL